MRRILSNLRKSEDGQALAEFALVVPLLLVLLLGVVDLGRAINYWNDLNHVANLGARYGAVGSTGPTCNGTTPSSLKNYILCEAGIDSAKLNGSSVCIGVPSASPSVGDPISVQVSKTYNWLPFLGLSVTSSTLTGNATMRLEQVPPSSGVWTQSTPCPGT